MKWGKREVEREEKRRGEKGREGERRGEKGRGGVFKKSKPKSDTLLQ